MYHTSPHASLSATFGIICAVLISVTLFFQQPCAADDAELIQTMITRTNARQAKVKSLRATWTETTGRRENPGNPLAPPVAPVKLKETQQVMTLRLGDELRTRIEVRPPVKPEEEVKGIDGRIGATISTFDGTRNWDFTSSIGDDDWDKGKFWTAKENDHGRDFQLNPWLQFCRGVQNPNPNLLAKDFKIIKMNEVINGHQCTVIEASQLQPAADSTFWVDFGRDCVILKRIDKHNGNATIDLTIEYKADPTLGWIPESWNGKFVRGGFSINGRLLSYEINPKLLPSDFEIKFPPGCIVFDQDRGHRYACLENGDKRIITPEESANGFNYFDLFPKKKAAGSSKK